MNWNIDFISEEDFTTHVIETIRNYEDKLEPFNLKKFNKNLIDPVKLIFDKTVYNLEWNQVIKNEIYRQRDKSNTNEIGYFHQKIFKYIKNCHVPEKGWDVEFIPQNAYRINEYNTATKIYVELKNKHNTMNGNSGDEVYKGMQEQIVKDSNCACFLVEAIAPKSRNIIWRRTIKEQKHANDRIRKVSIDKFYEIVTGQSDAFLKLCLALPKILKKIYKNKTAGLNLPIDTVYQELAEESKKFQIDEEMKIIMSLYRLGFARYDNFSALFTH